MAFEDEINDLDQHSQLIYAETGIGKNTNQRVGLLGKKISNIFKNLRNGFYQNFLRKDVPDTASGLITFLKGLYLGDFSEGPLGAGAKLTMEDGISKLEVDQLFVRMRAEFISVLIHEAKHIGGEFIVSAANMICSEVEEFSDFYRCYFDDDNGKVNNHFSNKDRAMCKVFSGIGQKFYWRKVIAVGPNYIELSKTDCSPGVNDIPQKGDKIFQLSSDDAERQSAIIISSVGADSPSIKQYAGINGYSLVDKETTVFSRKGNRIMGSTVFKSDGTSYEDWINGVEGTANTANNNANKAIADAEAAVADYNTKIGNLQSQIDGEISNWFYPYSPTLSNYPASAWTDAEKARHVGDTFTNTQNAPLVDAGKSWRFVVNSGVYSWTQIADSDAVLALMKASQAQSTADGKSTTYIITPTNYKQGDLWVLGADKTPYKQGEILTATQDSATFNEAHWIKKVRYTDDTAVNNLQIGNVNYYHSKSPISTLAGAMNLTQTQKGFTALGNYNFENPYSTLRLNKVITTAGEWTVKFKAKSNANVTLHVDICDGTVNTFNLTTEFQWYEFTYNVSNFTEALYNFIDFAMPSYAWYYIDDLIVVQGNKAPISWIEAPEDVQARMEQEIAQSKSAAEAAAKAYSDAQDNAKQVEANAYADGKVTAEEQRAIADANTKLQAAKAYSDAKDAELKLQQEAYADGKITESEAAAIATAKAYSDLKKTEAEAYADGKVTAEEQRAIADANTKLQAAKDYAATLDAQIQIGVENFYHTKSAHANLDVVLFSKTAKGFEGIGNYNGQYPNSTIRINNIISSNGDWTVKFKAKANANVSLLCDVCDLTVNTFPLSTEFQEFQFTKNVTNYTEGGLYHFIDFVFPSYAWYYIEDLMVVKGNKAPASWIESSEDVQARIAEAKSKADEAAAKTQFQTKIDGGLIYTAMMKLVDAISKNETAGLNGIPGNGTNPAFWAGGTYSMALKNTAKAIIRHDGKTKFTDTEVEGVIKALSGIIGNLRIDGNGRLYIVDANGTERFRIGNIKIPKLASLRGAAETANSVTVSAKGWQTSYNNIDDSFDFTETLYVAKDGSDITVKSYISMNGYCEGGDDYYRMEADVYLQHTITGTRYSVGKLEDSNYGNPTSTSSSLPIDTVLRNMHSGTYRLHADVRIDIRSAWSNTYASINIGETKLSSLYVTDLNQSMIGENGIMSFFGKQNYFYAALDENNRMNIGARGIVNVPGVPIEMLQLNQFGARVYAMTGTDAKPDGDYFLSTTKNYEGQYRVNLTGFSSRNDFLPKVSAHVGGQNPHYAQIIGYDYNYVDVWTADDASCNNGGFLLELFDIRK